MSNEQTASPWPRGAVFVVSLAAVVWLLQHGQTVALPLIMAFFAAAALQPLQLLVQRHVPKPLRPLGTIVAALTPVVVIVGVVIGLFQLLQWVAPSREEVSELIDTGQSKLQPLLDRVGIDMPQLTDHMGRIFEQATSTVSSAVGAAIAVLLVLYFLMLLLSESSDLQKRVTKHLGSDARDTLVESVHTIGQKVRQFLLMRSVTGLISATLSTVWLLIMGVDYALLWGLIVFFMNFIPNLGSLIAAGPPILVATLEQGPLTGAAVAFGLFCIEQVVGNMIDPRLQGNRLRLSPFMVLFSVVFFTWLWGIPGTLVAVPCLVLVVVVMEQIPAAAPYAGLLRRTSGAEPLIDDVEPESVDPESAETS